MGFGKRLKERREIMGLSRQDLARKIGVTPSAIANYENSISFPKTELLFALFDALDCDANYLYQDFLHTDGGYTIEEWDLIRKYRQLGAHSQELVHLVVEKELEYAPEGGGITYAAVARSSDASAKELTIKKDFSPDDIENEVDF